MSDLAEKYPDIAQQLDTDASYQNTYIEFKDSSGNELIAVIQRGEDAGSSLFAVKQGAAELIYSDTVVPTTAADFDAFQSTHSLARVAGNLIKASSAQHGVVHNAAISSVGTFRTDTGPDGGNLACCWAVRHLIHNAIGIWVTKTDGTSVFGAELSASFGSEGEAFDDVLAGGIVISPTGSGRGGIGHVGILGSGTGDSRLIYSNSSPHARWEQNHTVASWKRHYVTSKGLAMLAFPLGIPGIL